MSPAGKIWNTFAITHLNAWFAQVHAQSVRVLAVVLDQFLQRPEGGPPGNEESTLVQLPDSVVLHSIAVADCSQFREESREAEMREKRNGVSLSIGGVGLGWSPTACTHPTASSHYGGFPSRESRMHRARFPAAAISSPPLFSWSSGSTTCAKKEKKKE